MSPGLLYPAQGTYQFKIALNTGQALFKNLKRFELVVNDFTWKKKIGLTTGQYCKLTAYKSIYFFSTIEHRITEQ